MKNRSMLASPPFSSQNSTHRRTSAASIFIQRGSRSLTLESTRFTSPRKRGEVTVFENVFRPVQSSAEPRTKPDVLRAKIPPVRINVSHYFRVKSRINNDGSLYRVVSRLDHSRYRWRRKGRRGKIKKKISTG